MISRFFTDQPSSLESLYVFKPIENMRDPNIGWPLTQPAPSFERARTHAPPAGQI
jgi:hypothetical protein